MGQSGEESGPGPGYHDGAQAAHDVGGNGTKEVSDPSYAKTSKLVGRTVKGLIDGICAAMHSLGIQNCISWTPPQAASCLNRSLWDLPRLWSV